MKWGSLDGDQHLRLLVSTLHLIKMEGGCYESTEETKTLTPG